MASVTGLPPPDELELDDEEELELEEEDELELELELELLEEELALLDDELEVGTGSSSAPQAPSRAAEPTSIKPLSSRMLRLCKGVLSNMLFSTKHCFS
jgi:hypothetical protein